MHRLSSGLVAILLSAAPALGGQTGFTVAFDPAVQPEAYSGRVYVALSQEAEREPRLGMNAWFDPPPLYALDVADVAPGGSVAIDERALFHPVPLAELAPGTWRAQAVARRSLDGPKPGVSAGDLYGPVVAFHVGPDGAFRPDGELEAEPDGAVEDATAGAPVALRLDAVVAERPFEETERVKLFELVSARLSEFHGRPITMRAGVVLPEGWTAGGNERYPIVYRVPGFGGTHHGALRGARRRDAAGDAPGERVLQVVLDPSCHRGHHVFADSANNGPWGAALVLELVPALEERFRGPLDARYRFVTGGSSGGWSSLWLQITYPEHFGACYSHVPDPVDFRDFQCIDLYAGQSLYVDEHGERRPLARARGEVRLWYEDFVARETVLGPGGQIHSFEAVFSPRGPDGEPLALFDRETGVVDPAVAKSWEPYDVRLVLERGWAELGARLQGKLHVWAGEVDTFYLEGATRLLAEFLDTVETDAVCEIVPGMAHSSHGPGEQEMFRDLLERWAAREAVPAGH